MSSTPGRSSRESGGPRVWDSIYLDIETTGLSPEDSEIAIIGLHRVKGRRCDVVQLVGDEVSAERLVRIIRGAAKIYSYNGTRFDLPFIKARLGVDLVDLCGHRDLMHDCWRHDLRGGLKQVERQLGIGRRLEHIDGRMAVRLWWDYYHGGDERALAILKAYNREDVINLRVLRRKLRV